ncbi:MAG: chemotaxis protein CheA, partial [Nitrospinales bacterium]
TIKGTCGFLGFYKLESITHVGENLLSKLRDGKLSMSPDITSALLSMVDAVRQILSCIETEKNEGNVDYSALIEELTRLNQAENSAVPPAPEASQAQPSEAPASSPATPEPVAKVTSKPEKTPAPPQKAPTQETKPAIAKSDTNGDKNGVEKKTAVSEANIRVDVGLLDRLMNLVGELVLARNQILQFANNEKDPTFVATTQHLNLVTTELQEGVMKTRMQPIGNIWSKFPRVVRDISLNCGKKVRVEMEGKETELDKTLVEAIKDPLTHIVRNSVDHGIESPEVRKANGKPEEGRISLRAFHEGGQVNIEISDDGGGIDPDRLKAKALERELITPEQAARMNDREIVNLVFLPGFSTAKAVTNISGRGVGMDVVKTNIEKIGGTVDIQSKLGEGTTLKVKIPLTLAIIPALTVACGGQRYAIPQVSLLELVRLDTRQNGSSGVEMIQGTPVYRLRGNLLPLVYLNKELNVESQKSKDEEESIFIVVLQADDRPFGLVVEEIHDTEEIVVKPLGKQLKDLSAFAGATIMGDGKVALILDVMGLAQQSHVVSEVRERARVDKKDDDLEKSGDKQSLLIFGIGENGRMAIPLSMVARLEEFQRDSVELSGEQEVVQYREEIMPLVSLSKIFANGNGNGHHSAEEHQTEMIQAVVYTENSRSIGFVVDRIIDIVEEEVVIKRNSNRPGIMGSTVVQEKVTDMVDIKDVIKSMNLDVETQAMVAMT